MHLSSLGRMLLEDNFLSWPQLDGRVSLNLKIAYKASWDKIGNVPKRPKFSKSAPPKENAQKLQIKLESEFGGSYAFVFQNKRTS